MAYKKAIFNSVTLGDSVVKGPTTTSISRTIISDEVSDLTGIRTSNRGGGRQQLEVKCIIDFATEAAKLVYLEDLWSAAGLTKGTLSTTTPALAWGGCLMTDIAPIKETGKVLWFKVGFIRSI